MPVIGCNRWDALVLYRTWRVRGWESVACLASACASCVKRLMVSMGVCGAVDVCVADPCWLE